MLPDLILLDGGRGQVNAVRQAIAGTELARVPLFGMVKDDHHHRTRAIVTGEGREIAINLNRGVFTFVTAIQDEVHRFAITYQRWQQKKKKVLCIHADGGARRRPGHGQSPAGPFQNGGGAVRQASPDELAMTDGVGPAMAQRIYGYFHGERRRTEPTSALFQ